MMGHAMILAKADWPDMVDGFALVVFLTLVVLLPALGYWFMVIDIRAYLRALRGMLMVVQRRFRPTVPDWARRETPGCIRSLGLELPCTEEDIKQAYRRLADEVHPDRGGDRHRFMVLRRQFEEALCFLRDDEA